MWPIFNDLRWYSIFNAKMGTIRRTCFLNGFGLILLFPQKETWTCECKKENEIKRIQCECGRHRDFWPCPRCTFRNRLSLEICKGCEVSIGVWISLCLNFLFRSFATFLVLMNLKFGRGSAVMTVTGVSALFERIRQVGSTQIMEGAFDE